MATPMQKSLLLFALTLLAGACATRQRFADVPKTFLEDVDVGAKRENLPFDHAWLTPGADSREYEFLMIKPIRIDTLGGENWKRSMSISITSREDFDKEAAEIAEYFDGEIRKRLTDGSATLYKLIDAPGEKTLILEIALTELEFSHPVARAGALAAPIPGVAEAMSTVADPHAAFAARVNDAITGELLATFADRRFPPKRIIDVNKLTATSSVREVCSIWAGMIDEMLDPERKEAVSDKRFSVLPW
jgi:hypothetical protein